MCVCVYTLLEAVAKDNAHLSFIRLATSQLKRKAPVVTLNHSECGVVVKICARNDIPSLPHHKNEHYVFPKTIVSSLFHSHIKRYLIVGLDSDLLSE